MKNPKYEVVFRDGDRLIIFDDEADEVEVYAGIFTFAKGKVASYMIPVNAVKRVNYYKEEKE